MLDSNVIVSGFAFRRGNPYEILSRLGRDEIVVYISPFILEEVARALRESFDTAKADIKAAVGFLRQRCHEVNPPPYASLAELSPEDNRVVDCAVDGKVDYLVTGDRAVQKISEFEGISVVSPAQFIDILRGDSS